MMDPQFVTGMADDERRVTFHRAGYAVDSLLKCAFDRTCTELTLLHISHNNNPVSSLIYSGIFVPLCFLASFCESPGSVCSIPCGPSSRELDSQNLWLKS